MPRFLLFCMVLLPGVATAAGHDEALLLRRAGKVVPLRDLLQQIRAQSYCRLLDAQIHQEGQRYVYELKVLDLDGRVRELEYDAVSGKLLEYERGD